MIILFTPVYCRCTMKKEAFFLVRYVTKSSAARSAFSPITTSQDTLCHIPTFLLPEICRSCVCPLIELESWQAFGIASSVALFCDEENCSHSIFLSLILLSFLSYRWDQSWWSWSVHDICSSCKVSAPICSERLVTLPVYMVFQVAIHLRAGDWTSSPFNFPHNCWKFHLPRHGAQRNFECSASTVIFKLLKCGFRTAVSCCHCCTM